MKNKKYIIGFLIAGVVIIGGVYFYRKNKRENEQKADEQKPKEKNPKLVTEEDALKVLDFLNKRDTPLTPTQTKVFVELYMTKVNKATSDKILVTIQKKESDWNFQDKLNFGVLLAEVLIRLKENKAVN